jgi:hypothetical protein
MYDDGPGSGNLDCRSAGARGCWGHRHDVLWRFDGDGPLAMGAATGTDSQGVTGYATLVVRGDNGYQPHYTYRWSQAVAAGADGGSPGTVAASSSGGRSGGGGGLRQPSLSVTSLRLSGHRIVAHISATRQLRLSCALTRRRAHGFGSDRFRSCGAWVGYSGLRPGHYRLRVGAPGAATVTRYITVS